MASSFERVSVLLASNLGRRDLLKGVAGTLAGAAMAMVPGSVSMRAQSRDTDGPIGAVLRLRMPNGSGTILKVPDRYPARITYQGERITLVPNIMPSTQQMELLIYHGGGGAESAKRLTLPFARPAFSVPRLASTVPTVPLGLEFADGVSIGAVAMVAIASLPQGEDCCVDCSWGQACASAVCCEAGDPEQGHCCDPGFCKPPPCSPA